MSQRMWSLTAKELRDLLLVFALVTVGFLARDTFDAAVRYRTDQLELSDFVHFYLIGSLAAEGRGDLLYDIDAQRLREERLVPASKGTWFVPVYGPQAALLFAGLSQLPYRWAALVWEFITIGLYAACTWAVWRRCPSLRMHGRVVALAAMGFTPFYMLVLHGQTSAVPLLCITLGYLALRQDRQWWAGAALGFLAVKPQLGVAVAAVMLVRREWRVIGGAIAAIGLQWGMSLLVMGPGPLQAYFHMLREAPRLATLLEPRPRQMHSLRAFWALLSPESSVSLTLYLLTSAAVLWLAVRLWRKSVPLEIRYSGLVVASILISPHTGAYELVLLAPAFILTASKSEQLTAPRRRVFRVILSLAYLVPLVSAVASVIEMQLSTPVFVAWLVALLWTEAPTRAGFVAVEGSNTLAQNSCPGGHEGR